MRYLYLNYVEPLFLNKDHCILINKIIDYNKRYKLTNLHQNEKELEFFKYISKCIGFIENISSCQQAILDEKELLPALLNALSIQDDVIFATILQDLIPFLVYPENGDALIKYFQNETLYTNISNVLKKEPNLLVIKCLVSFLNAAIAYFNEINGTINFILHLQKESIITQLRTINVQETEKVYHGLQYFLKNADAILVPLNQIFTPSISINPFDHKDVYDYILNQIGEKDILNMNLSLIELKCHHSRQFEKAYVFMNNFLTFYRHFLSKGINISINDIASKAAKMNQPYNPGSNAEFTEDFYVKLYKKSSFVPSVILKNTNCIELDKEEKDDPLTNECHEENEILIQQIASLCSEREKLIKKNSNLTPIIEELEALKLENAQIREEKEKLNIQLNALRSLSAKTIQERDELQKIIDEKSKDTAKQSDQAVDDDNEVVKKEDYIRLKEMVKVLSCQLDEKRNQYNQIVSYFNQKLESKDRALNEVKRNIKQANEVFSNLDS